MALPALVGIFTGFCGMPASAQTSPSPLVGAATAFLASLNDDQRGRVVFARDDDQQRKRWSNFPVPVVPRGGLSLKEMTPPQRSAVWTLLAIALSERGLEKVEQIMQGDEVNKLNELAHPTGPRGPGGPPPYRDGRQTGGNRPPGPPPGMQPGMRRDGPPPSPENLFGQELYYISFVGVPSDNEPWMLQFGGHHLALNMTVSKDGSALTPTLTGAQPALYKMDGKDVRPLGRESDKALALVNALDAGQRKQAILGYQVPDLVLGPGQDGKTIQPEGLKGSAMNAEQRRMLLDVIAEWANIANPTMAGARMADLEADLAETWFAWSGPTTTAPGSNITAYYRIQGPRLVIEYAPQGPGEEGALHVHTMYRDPTNDYGRKFGAK